jgi:hypothetical protein
MQWVWSADRTFVALTTGFKNTGTGTSISADHPLSFELSEDGIKYSTGAETKLNIRSASKPRTVRLNSTVVRNFTYDKGTRTLTITVPAGEGLLNITL